MNSQLLQSMVDNQVRAEEILHIGTMLHASEQLPDTLKEALDMDVDDILEVMSLPAVDDDGEYTDPVDVIAEQRKNGWLVRFSTPVPEFYIHEGAVHHRRSWGHHANSWFYGDDYEQLCNEAIEWANQFFEERRQKFNAKIG